MLRVLGTAGAGDRDRAAGGGGVTRHDRDVVPSSVTVNGRRRALEVAAHHTLLDVLRDDLALTGTKECCLVGECGACTVIVDGRIVDSCLVLAVEVDGARRHDGRGAGARRAR